MGIASSILDVVNAEAERRPGARVLKVGLRIGEWAGVDPDSLRFCFEAIAASGEADPIALEIETCPRRNRCTGCQAVFTVDGYAAQCPQCGGSSTEHAGGDELEIAYMEIEEP